MKPCPSIATLRVRYWMTATDGNGVAFTQSGDLAARYATPIASNEDGTVLDLYVFPQPDDGYPANALVIPIPNVPYSPVANVPGTWTGA